MPQAPMSEVYGYEPGSPEAMFADAYEVLGLQSYVYFRGDAGLRKNQKAHFLDGTIENPVMDYPALNAAALDDHENRLTDLMRIVSDIEGGEAIQTAYWGAAGYRLAEVYFLREALRLNTETDPAKKQQSAERFMQMNRELYGELDKGLFDSAVAEVWRQIDQKELGEDERGQQVKQELEQMLFRPQDAAPLIEATPEERQFYNQAYHEEFADVEELVMRHWEEIQGRCLIDGTEPQFTAEDMYELMVEYNRLTGADTRGITVEMIDGSSLDFEPTIPGYQVGRDHKPIKSPLKMFARLVHEGKWHGQGFDSGMQSGLVVAGTGQYGYIWFEESAASRAEMFIEDEPDQYDYTNLGHYIHAGLAEGADGQPPRTMREVFEIAWRYRLLMSLKNGERIDDKKYDSMRSTTYDRVLNRIFAGTPANMPGVAFHKNLAYLGGGVDSLAWYKAHVGDRQAFREAFASKSNLNNQDHLAAVEANRLRRAAQA